MDRIVSLFQFPSNGKDILNLSTQQQPAKIETEFQFPSNGKDILNGQALSVAIWEPMFVSIPFKRERHSELGTIQCSKRSC